MSDISAEIAQDIDNWLAAGNHIEILPGPTFAPLPIRKITEPAKPLKKRVTATIKNTQWVDKGEIEKMRHLRSCGHTFASIAAILNTEFDNDRTPEGVKSAFQRTREGTIRRSVKGSTWSAEEESWLAFLAKYGFNFREISEIMNRFLGLRDRNPHSIRQYAISRGVKVRREKGKNA